MRLPLILLSLALTGCAVNVPPPQTAAPDRVSGISTRFTIANPTLKFSVRILETDAVGAYAWPNGTIYISRGLIDRADDEMIAAAIAHEVGHLLCDGHASAPVSVSGYPNLGQEGLADAYGLELLRQQNIPSHAMPRMLRLVRDSNRLPADSRQAMDERIAWLERL